MNYIESFPTLIFFVCLSGLYYPTWSIIGAWGIFVGRLVYIFGYRVHPKMRIPGALIMMICNMTMMVMSVISCFMYLNNEVSSSVEADAPASDPTAAEVTA